MTENTATVKAEETVPQPSTVGEYRPLNVKDALGYLDKVKAKFAAPSDVYNQFLDIMKDFKSQMIDTPGVIERVSTLFRGHPALISGFNTFLPPGYRIECSVDEQERNIIKVTTPSGTTSINESEPLNLRGENNKLQPQPQEEQKPPVEFNHAITYVNKVKSYFSNTPDIYKKFLEVLQTYQKDQKPIEEVYAEVQVLFNNSNDLLDEFKQFLPDPKQRKKRLGNIPTLNISKRTKHHHTADIQTSDIRSQPSIQDEDAFSRPTFSAEEAAFFEKVKTYIGNKATYNAFLKVLNLFSQQIVDQDVLVNRVESFIGGNPELFELFKTLVGYDGSEESSEQVQKHHVSNDTKRGSTSSQDCGPSYRHVSKVWENRTCSGRDGLCWDVLNDTYISHPTWASEDTGFVAAKKNQYEEALHRVEEERYDYDLNIEANLNTIALLEPIAKKISIMSPEEKASFRLTPGLGSPSQTIYHRIMKKIYGPQKGLEMIDLLHNNPSQTVPIVLKRLKQKDDEWKRAQREWNKIWREVEAKNYWKSLDYQGILFKITDRKAMTTRSLVSQAESLRSQKPNASIDKLTTPQFIFPFTDLSVFKDVSRLIYFYLDRQPVYNPEDCTSMREFMNTMIPMFFQVTDVEPSTVEDIGEILTDEVVDDDSLSVQSDDIKSPSTPMRTSKRARRGRNQLNDDDGLLKDVLTRNMNTTKKKKSSRSTSSEDEDENEEEDEDDDENDSQTNTNAEEEDDEENEGGDEDEEEDEDDEEDEEEEINRSGRPSRRATRTSHRHSRQAAKKSQRNKKKSNGLVNPKVATLASLIEKDKPVDSVFMNRTYSFFGDNGFYCFFRLYQILYERLYKMKMLDAEFKESPEKAKKAREEARDLGITPKRFNALKMNTKRGYYSILLSLIDKLFEGEVDQQTFEESVRYIFGTDAYIMFTIDKLVLSIVRHIHIIIADNQSQELYELFKETNQNEGDGHTDINAYIDKANEIIGSTENIYYINFKLKTRTLGIQLIDGHIPTNGSAEESGGYDTYVANYIDWSNETKGIDQTALTPRFLKRNLKYHGNQSKNIIVQSGMQYKICRDTYHMFYIIGTEDAFVRKHKKRPVQPNSTKWRQWLNEHWSQGLSLEEKQRAETEALSTFHI